jgi:hypothetical protein
MHSQLLSEPPLRGARAARRAAIAWSTRGPQSRHCVEHARPAEPPLHGARAARRAAIATCDRAACSAAIAQ